MRRPRSFHRRSGKPVHPTTWCVPANGIVDLTLGAASPSTQVLCSAAELLKFTSPTLVRIKGDLTVGSTSTALVQESHVLTMGIIVADEDLVFTDLMGSVQGLQRPWLWLWSGSVGTIPKSEPRFTSAGAFVALEQSFQNTRDQVHVDVKAMRRVPENSQVYIVGSVIDFFGSGDALVRGTLRLLIKE